jgi:hypothetical protein
LDENEAMKRAEKDLSLIDESAIRSLDGGLTETWSLTL